MTACAWCEHPLPETMRRDAVCCSVRCRQARHRFQRAAGSREAGAGAGGSRWLAYADPPYPGKAWLYRGHPDYRGEVDVAALVTRMHAGYDGWALSTSARALPAVLAVCPDEVRVAAWHRGPRPRAGSCYPLSAWEPLIYCGPRSIPTDSSTEASATEVCVEPSPLEPRRVRAHGAPGEPSLVDERRVEGRAARRVDSLVHGVAPMTTLPGRVIGAKPAAFCRWLFDLLGARPGDHFDDLFPGSGAVSRAWAAYTGEASRTAGSDGYRPEASSPAGRDGSTLIGGHG